MTDNLKNAVRECLTEKERFYFDKLGGMESYEFYLCEDKEDALSEVRRAVNEIETALQNVAKRYPLASEQLIKIEEADRKSGYFIRSEELRNLAKELLAEKAAEEHKKGLDTLFVIDIDPDYDNGCPRHLKLPRSDFLAWVRRVGCNVTTVTDLRGDEPELGYCHWFSTKEEMERFQQEESKQIYEDVLDALWSCYEGMYRDDVFDNHLAMYADVEIRGKTEHVVTESFDLDGDDLIPSNKLHQYCHLSYKEVAAIIGEEKLDEAIDRRVEELCKYEAEKWS